MAVVPSLAAMAALTLFQNPHMQPEGYSVDYSAYSAPATVIQRRQRRRIGAVTRIATAIRGWLARRVHIAFPLHTPAMTTWTRPLTRSRMREHLRQSMFTYPYNMYPYALAPLLKRRDNMLEARSNYRSTSRNRTFGNIPLGMQ
jgi:hypothetical protein